MKIEIRKQYRTRDGRIASVTKQSGLIGFPFIARVVPDVDGEDIDRLYRADGFWAAPHCPTSFDLVEEIPAPAIFDAAKPVQCRDGRAVRILTTDAKRDCNIVALVTAPRGKEEIRSYLPNGRYILSSESPEDLVNIPPAPKKIVGYVNVYNNGATGRVHFTRTHAERQVSKGRQRVACVPVTIEYADGEGL